MKTIAAILAFACLAHSALASVAPEECDGAPSTKCSAVSTLQIEVTQGKCSGTSSANCKTWSQSQEVFQEAYQEWWSEGDKVCDGNTIEVAAEAVALAIAKVWVSAAVDVKCNDDAQGFACGWSFANGETFGASVAEALALAAADASLALEEAEDEEAAGVADAFCFTDIRAIGAAMAQAAAEASADACTKGGEDPVQVYQDAFVESIQKVVASAFASASASVCQEEDGDLVATSECAGTAEVDTKGAVGGEGKFCAGVTALPACEGVGEETCCDTGKRRLCRISKKTCPDCAGPWKKIKGPGEREIWENRKGATCFCKGE